MPSTGPSQPDYSFLTDPSRPSRKIPFSFGSSSWRMKLLFVGIALVVLMIIYVVIKNVTATPSTSVYYVSVAQDQQELSHLSMAAAQQQGVNTATLNSAVTVQATMNSSLSSMLSYMKANGIKSSTAVLAAKQNPNVDSLLTSAASAGTYDQTYKTVMRQALTTYGQDLNVAYVHALGPKGRALLRSDYASQQLLLTQLNQG